MDDHANTFEAPWLAAGVNYQRKFQSARVADAGESTIKSVGETAEGVLCAELLCWPYMRGEACTCDGKLAHILKGACGRNINLGFGRHRAKSCGFARCNATSHPSEEECHRAIAAWWRETRGAEPEFGKRPPPAPANTAARGERSTLSAQEGAGKRCTLPASKLREHLARHEGESKHLHAFLRDPMLEAMLSDERLRALLAMRSRVKEVTEAWSVCEQVRALLDADALAAGGAGVVVLDFCSGKGLGATLLSFALPAARIVMLDANGEMDLAHVCARPNVSFRHADIFSSQLPALVRQEAEGAAVCIAVGMHLCGPFSPRLIDVAFAVDAIDALLLCPCCLKGGHGKAVALSAKERGCDPYALLIETLRAICEREIAGERAPAAPGAPDDDEGAGAPPSRLQVVLDTEMLSPRNVFLALRKGKRAARAPRCESELRCEPCVP